MNPTFSNITSLDTFIEEFSAKSKKSGKFSDYSFFPVIQENSPNEKSIDKILGNLEEKDIKSFFKYLDDFFVIYLDNFKGDECEPLEKLLLRVVPIKFHGQINTENLPEIHKKLQIEENDFIDTNSEDYSDYIARLNSSSDQTVLLICNNEENIVVGGMIIEYYAKRDNGIINTVHSFKPVSFAILTYIFIKDSKLRHQRSVPKGLGTFLIKYKLPLLINNEIYSIPLESSVKDKGRPEYVFFEVDSPQYIQTETNKHEKADFSISTEEYWCIERLNFFNKVGARWIDISYVQPKLDKTKERVYQLLFMVLPHVSIGLDENPFIINKLHVLDFLVSFYNTNEETDIKLNEFSCGFVDNSNNSILPSDEDLSRSWLRMQLSDVLDDIENNQPKYNIRSLIKLQSDIEDDFDSKADKRNESVSITKRWDSFLDELKSLNLKKANGNIYLKEVPKYKTPKLLFDKASIAFHIALKPKLRFSQVKYDSSPNIGLFYEYNVLSPTNSNEQKCCNFLLLKENNKIQLFDDINCPIFNSYENDLLSHKYYDKRAPFKSKRLSTFKLKITFPYKIEFLSEGRKESILINSKPDRFAEAIEKKEKKYFKYSKEVKCILNLMYFKPDEIKDLEIEYNSISNFDSPNEKEQKIIREYEYHIAQNLVWELIFTNDTHKEDITKKEFTEYEIIQLAKFFSGKQEKSTIQLEFGETEKDSFNEHLIKILEDITKRNPTIYDVQAGTIQIDTLNTKILTEINSLDSENEVSQKAINYSYLNLFLPEKENEEANSTIKPNYQNNNFRLKTLLEEYLKDRVDNLELLDEIYFQKKGETEPISNLEVYRNIKDFHFDDAYTGFEDRYNENEFLKYFLDTLCGISLGIFDFERMGYEEVTDTISPLYESATDKALIVMKRASLFSACHDNSVYESSINTIGISPYLIIPNSVLVYNRLQAEQNKQMIDDIFKLTKDEIDPKDFNYLKEKAKKILNIKNDELYQILLSLRKRTETYIDKINIANVFNYSTEQEIYSRGMKDRGIEENIYQIQETKKELDESIKDLLDIRQTIFGTLVTIFLGILSFSSLWDPIVTHFDYEFDGFYIVDGFLQGYYTFNVGALIFSILFITFLIYFGRRLFYIIPKYIISGWFSGQKRYIFIGLFIVLCTYIFYIIKKFT